MGLVEGIKAKLLGFIQNIMQKIIYTLIWPFRITNNLLTLFLEWSLMKAKTTAQRSLLAFVVFLTMLWISVISYASFYNLYIPPVEISKPVHLGFSVCPEGSGICSFPSANVTFGRYSQIEEVLGAGQKYKVILELDMPDSPVNQNIGMFMVLIRMYDRHYHISAESRRSVVAKYKSFPLRMLDLFIWSPFYFFGFKEEKQLVMIELFSAFVDDYYRPSVGATIEVQNHMIQIYSAQVKLFASFSGLKYILHNWPITSAVFGIWWNMCFCLLVLANNIYNKKTTIRMLSHSLNLQNETDDENGSVSIVDDSKSGDDISEYEDVALFNQSTQTKQNEEDDVETYDLPVVQEPADFIEDDEEALDLELMTELRQRRLH